MTISGLQSAARLQRSIEAAGRRAAIDQVAPVMKAPASLISKAATLATSSAVVGRPAGHLANIFFAEEGVSAGLPLAWWPARKTGCHRAHNMLSLNRGLALEKYCHGSVFCRSTPDKMEICAMILKDQSYCPACGSKLSERHLDGEGFVPYCEQCATFRFPQYNVTVSMIVRDAATGRILLIQQYGRPFYILVAGYVNRGERAEDAVVREIREETGMTVERIHFNRTKFFEPSNTLMINFTAFIDNASTLHTNAEIDRYKWFTPEEARANIKPGSLAAEFLNAYLDEL